MTTYTYQATDSSGNQREGTVDALSLQAARDAVMDLGLQPIEIYESALPTTAPADDSPWVDPMSAAPPPPAPDNTVSESSTAYFPFLETLRLYAGWLLAWYSIVYAVGAYQFLNDVPFRIPYAESLFLSPLVLSFTFAAYLFLLLSSIYKATGSSKKKALLLSVLGIVIFILYRINVQ